MLYMRIVEYMQYWKNGVVYDLSIERSDESEEAEGCESSQQLP